MITIKKCQNIDLHEFSAMVNRIERELKTFAHVENLTEYQSIKKQIDKIKKKVNDEYDKRQA